MFFRKMSPVLVFQIALMVFYGCNVDSNIYQGNGTANDLNNKETEDDQADYLNMPDTDFFSGGSDKNNENNPSPDEDLNSSENEVADSDEIPDYENDSIYKFLPDVSKCYAGELSRNEKNKVLIHLNYIRSLHGLAEVSYQESDDVLTAECSLIIVSNKKLDHEPPSTSKCYSDDGFSGCENSNIYIRTGGDTFSLPSESIINAFMTDENVDSLGHRRWFIDPWLKYISFGRVDDTVNNIAGAAVKIKNQDERDNVSETIKFVVYPYNNYPAELYNDNVMMSFTLIVDSSNKWKNGLNNVKFGSAAIAIKDPANKTIKIKGMKFDNEGYGVPNNIRWFAEGIKSNIKYNVVITNVLVNNVSKNFDYWFELK